MTSNFTRIAVQYATLSDALDEVRQELLTVSSIEGARTLAARANELAYKLTQAAADMREVCDVLTYEANR